MGIAERKEREREQRRIMIIEAAERLYFSKGIANTTMDDVAEEAELSKGTIYLYFKNKEDLSHGIYLRGLTILKSFFEEAISNQKRGIDKVRAIGMAYFRFSKEHADYFEAMMNFEPKDIDLGETETYSLKCHNCSEEVMSIVARGVQIGIEDGSIRAGLDPLKTAFILWGQSSGLIQIVSRMGKHIQDFHGLDPEDLITQWFDMVYHGLRTDTV